MSDSLFRRAVSDLVNEHSREGLSNTPDYILAGVMVDAMQAYERATQRRDGFYQEDGVSSVEAEDGRTQSSGTRSTCPHVSLHLDSSDSAEGDQGSRWLCDKCNEPFVRERDRDSDVRSLRSEIVSLRRSSNEAT